MLKMYKNCLSAHSVQHHPPATFNTTQSPTFQYLLSLANMRFIDNVVVASAFASVVSASPLVRRGNAFTVTQSVAKTQKAAGPVALAQVYGKYAKTGAQVPDVVKAAAINATRYDDGSVATTPTANDEEYLTPVSIGGQTLNLDFDTGSSDLYVYLLHFRCP